MITALSEEGLRWPFDDATAAAVVASCDFGTAAGLGMGLVRPAPGLTDEVRKLVAALRESLATAPSRPAAAAEPAEQWGRRLQAWVDTHPARNAIKEGPSTGTGLSAVFMLGFASEPLIVSVVVQIVGSTLSELATSSRIWPVDDDTIFLPPA